MRMIMLGTGLIVGCAAAGTPTGEIGEFDGDAAPPDGPAEAGSAGPPDAALGDAGVVLPDAGGAVPGACALGAVRSAATSDQLDVLGNVVYYAKGQTLPAGKYRAAYAGGCFKLSFALKWTVQGGTADTDGWFLVSDSTAEHILKLPGTGRVDSEYAGGFDTFAECVSMNASVPPVEFEWRGGPLGVWLQDFPYLDNVVGEGGQNPAWSLTLLTECPKDIDLR